MTRLIRACVAGCLLAVASFGHAEVIDLEGTVKAVDAESRTISIERKTPKGTKTLELEVTKKAGDLGSVKAGDKISFSYDPDLEVVTEIDVPGNDIVPELQGVWLAYTEETGGKRIKKEEMRAKQKTLTVEGNRFTLSTHYYQMNGNVEVIREDGSNAINLEGPIVYGETRNGKFVAKGDGQLWVLK